MKITGFLLTTLFLCGALRVHAQLIVGSEFHSLFRCSTGEVMACGNNSDGALGDGTWTSTNYPVQVSGLSDITSVTAGGYFSMFLKIDSTVWVCGDNAYGQLGDGTNTHRILAVQVSALSGITAIAAGGDHSLFVKNDGTVWACGRNFFGQLGDGTNNDRNSPVQVSGLSGITSAAGGRYHSLFLKNDGTVWACGRNIAGALGDGTTTDRLISIQVSGLTDVTATDGGLYHSLFLKNDGTVWACGANSQGQLGDGTTTQRLAPVQVTALSGITAVAAGWRHSLFLKNDGTVWACGYNNYGQLGDGTTTQRLTPVQVSGLTGIIAIATNGEHSLFLRNDGTVWACGENSLGQFGDGTYINSASPVQVQNLCMVSAEISYGAVRGNIFADVNANCNEDLSDFQIPGRVVKAEPGPFFGISDVNGNYEIRVPDTGTYTLSVATIDSLWLPSCTTSHTVNITTIPDTVSGIDFALSTSVFCARLTVELGTSRLRRCAHNIYTVRYANTGSFPASNAYIAVDFGDYLQPQSSSIPWSTVSGSVYTFPLGNINIYQQGSFNVTALLDCAADLGSTQCVTAHIYPDSLCFPTPVGWDKSETAVSGKCVNDSLVCFTIKNRSAAGSGDMGGAAQWRLYVNDTLVTQGTYQLAGGDSIVKCFPANGKTYRLEADQNLPHPRRSKPQAIVEACGSPTAFGFVNTVPQDDEESAVETFCMEVRGSFDPNDKQVSPAGITSNNYISAEDELEYLIRFQNTGNDTAFKVVIRDTIATDVLDIATLTSGASSHDYTFNIYGHGVAEWTFDNILLPDSNVNEEASHGFVIFKIQQLPGNSDGTLIENRVAIYFDFNAPVITNTAWNEVNEAGIPVAFLAASINSVDVACYEDSSGSATTIVTGGLSPYEYAWNNGATTATASNLLAGNYLVTVTDAVGTVLTDSVSIQDGYQVNTGTIAGADSADINQISTYSVNAGLSYTWSVSNGTIISGQGTNSIEVDWSAIGQGTVEVAVADSGCTQTVSKTVVLVDPTGVRSDLLSSIELFPNPTNGMVTLRAAHMPSSVLLRLYDSTGKEVMQQNARPSELQQGILLDLNKLNEGVFFLNIKTETETRGMKVVRY